MAEAMVWTPTDLLTGLALPFVPDADLPPVPQNTEKISNDIADWNHANHPRLDPTLQLDPRTATPDAGPAIRGCRIQFVLRPTHERYHREYYGPHLPQTTVGRFFMCAMAASGYVPEQALDFSGAETQIATLSHKQRERLRRSGEIKMGSGDTVHRFLLQFAVSEGTENVRPAAVEEFMSLCLNRRSPDKQAKLAEYLLDGLIEPIIAGQLRDTYRYGRKNSLLPPGSPASIFTFLRRELAGGERVTRRAIGRLAQQCVAYRYNDGVTAT